MTKEEMTTEPLHITDLLQLQKKRFAKWWWAMSIASVFLSFVWFLFQLWLLLHVIGIAPFGTPRRDDVQED